MLVLGATLVILKVEYNLHEHRKQAHAKKDQILNEILQKTNLDFSSVERQHSRESFDDVVHGNLRF